MYEFYTSGMLPLSSAQLSYYLLLFNNLIKSFIKKKFPFLFSSSPFQPHTISMLSYFLAPFIQQEVSLKSIIKMLS